MVEMPPRSSLSSSSSSSSESQNSLEIRAVPGGEAKNTNRTDANAGAKASGQVKWKENVKNADTATPGGAKRTRNMAENSLGGFSKGKLAPLTPLSNERGPAATVETNDRNAAFARTAVPMGFTYSSPNLKGMQELASNYEQARLRDYYHQNFGDRFSPFVDPMYQQLNPRLGGSQNKPVWSLNQPLPHVLNPSLARKISKNMEAQSRNSSQPGSKTTTPGPSHSGSLASISDWRKTFQRVSSSRKLNDIEAQLSSSTAAGQRPTAASKLDSDKPSNFHVEQKPNVAGRNHTNAKFTLNSDSYPNSIAGDDPTLANNSNSISPPEIPKASPPPVVTTASDDSDPLTFPNFWAKIRYQLREPFAEFLGTLILVIFGVGGNLQATVTKGAGGSYESLSFAWGFGCMLGVYVAGGVSGGHVNPAVTISMAIFRKFPWKKVPVYIFAQIVGAFFGGAMAYGYFWSSITEFEGGAHIRTAATGACLFTNPKDYVTWRNAFFDEFIGASILVGCLMALLDDSNAPPTSGMTALIVGFLVAAIGMALGFQTSFTINPARDLGPRIFASMIGYGPHAFHLTHWWWTWGTWGGPIAGGIAGALVYDIFIFTGCESPINYPDNGYIEHRVKRIMQTEMHLHRAHAEKDVTDE
ncbi:LAFA_0F12552g1_1 [Lachancea sp. 'fantastica']|nr:LAFA_0F12552g1_1 [Lachancea sp. 'fantastica']